MFSKSISKSAVDIFVRKGRQLLPPASHITSHQLPQQTGPYTSFSTSPASGKPSGKPPTWDRVGAPLIWPNEGPGVNYKFNWQLNADGVTPTRERAFRIMKPLDITVAGLTITAESVVESERAAAKVSVPAEAGTDAMPFDDFDASIRDTRDALSECPAIYSPEGLAPGLDIGVRVITNSGALASACAAYLDRAPRANTMKLRSQPITVYAYLGGGDGAPGDYAAFAVEEHEDGDGTAVATVGVASAEGPEVEALRVVIAAIDVCVKGLETEGGEAE